MCKRRALRINSVHENVAQIGQKCKTKANAFDFSQSQKLQAPKHIGKWFFKVAQFTSILLVQTAVYNSRKCPI